VYQALEPDVKGTRPITVQFEKYQVTIISLPFKIGSDKGAAVLEQ
jgi:hypothetical protein